MKGTRVADQAVWIADALTKAGQDGLSSVELRTATGLSRHQISTAWHVVRHQANGRQAVLDARGALTRYYLIDNEAMAQRDLVLQQRHITTRLESAIVFVEESLNMATRSGSNEIMWAIQEDALRNAHAIMLRAAETLRKVRVSTERQEQAPAA